MKRQVTARDQALEPVSQAKFDEAIAQTRFKSAAELDATLTQYVQPYNSRIPQRALDHRSPLQA
jgi:hypothetical protein